MLNSPSDDHSRVKLKAEINPSRSDYINASTIVSLISKETHKHEMNTVAFIGFDKFPIINAVAPSQLVSLQCAL